MYRPVGGENGQRAQERLIVRSGGAETALDFGRKLGDLRRLGLAFRIDELVVEALQREVADELQRRPRTQRAVEKQLAAQSRQQAFKLRMPNHRVAQQKSKQRIVHDLADGAQLRLEALMSVAAAKQGAERRLCRQ